MLKRLLGPLVLLLVLAACTRSGPPAIAVTVSPLDGAENVAVTAVVTADFNVAMNETTVEGAFTLSSSAGEVAGVLAYDATLRRATFTPSTDLAYDTEYTAAVAGTIRSAAGGRIPIPTTGEYAWSFTTESDPGPGPGPDDLVVGDYDADSAYVVDSEVSIDAPEVSGGTEPYGFALADDSSLPEGMELNADGSISGMADETGTFEGSVTVTDDEGESGSAAYSFVVVSVLSASDYSAASTYPQGASASIAAPEVLGGLAPYSFELTDGALPDGLELDLEDGTISGTPTETGEFSGTVTVTDALGQEATADFAFEVIVVLFFDDYDTEDGYVEGEPVSLAAVVGGGVAPYSFELDGVLPDGLELDLEDGTISGTPIQTGEFPGTVTVTDAQLESASVDFVIVVVGVLATDDYADAAFLVDEAITDIAAPELTGGLAPFSYELTDGALPDGLELDLEDGTISGTPTVTDEFSGEITVTDSLGQVAVAAFSFEVVEELTLDADYAPAAGYLLDEEIDPIAAANFEGGAAPFTYEVTDGTFPPGLTLEDDGTITGTPTEAGEYEFTITVTDFSGQSVDLVVEIVIAAPMVTTIHIDDTVDAGEDFASLSFIVSGGLAPFDFEVLDPTTDPIDPSDPEWEDKNPGVIGGWTVHAAGEHGDLPAGFVIEDDGSISGTATTADPFLIRAYVRTTDALGQTDVTQVEIRVNLAFSYSVSTVEYPTGYSADPLYRDCNSYAILVPGTGQAAFGFPDSAWTVVGHTGTLAFSRNVPADGLTHTRWTIGGSTGTLFRQYNATNNTTAAHNSNRTYTITVTDGGPSGTGATATFVIDFVEVAPASWTPAFEPGPHTPCA